MRDEIRFDRYHTETTTDGMSMSEKDWRPKKGKARAEEALTNMGVSMDQPFNYPEAKERPTSVTLVGKAYLGDGAYVAFDGYALVLTTENGIEVTNTVVLEPDVYAALVAYAERLKAAKTDGPVVPDVKRHYCGASERLTACGRQRNKLSRGSTAFEWAYVNCPACLATRPESPFT